MEKPSKTKNKQVISYIVGIIALFGLFGGPFLGTYGIVVVLCVGWGFGIAFVKMEWENQKNSSNRAGLAILLLVAIAISNYIAKSLQS